jgi:hypothetical protein
MLKLTIVDGGVDSRNSASRYRSGSGVNPSDGIAYFFDVARANKWKAIERIRQIHGGRTLEGMSAKLGHE